LFGQTFYHGLIRKYVILVGTLVNDIYIEREDANGNVVSLLKVPVTYAPKDKMLARVLQDPDLNRTSSTIPLPMIAFERGEMRYNGKRKLPTINKIVIKSDTDSSKMKYQYAWVPYDFEFKVHIFSKNAEDGTKIIEQILPFFTPAWTTTVQLISDTEETKDIPVVLNSVTTEDNYNGDYTERRAIVDTLHMTLQGYLYGPVKTSGIIKFVKVNFRIPTNVNDGDLKTSAVGNTAITEQITVQPGLTANGEPTSNINETIPYLEIDIDDDFGYITQIKDAEEADDE